MPLKGRAHRFERNGFDVRKLGSGRQEAIGEAAGNQLPFRVVDELVDKRAADALHRSAEHLPMHQHFNSEPGKGCM
jgi:hypothetical protein